jgi:arsenate reductase
MAEGIARKLFSDRPIQSAGSDPSVVNPHAVAVLSEWEIDISQAQSKSVDVINPDSVNLVITLCAEEVCPVVFLEKPRLHWPLQDPAAAPGDEDAVRASFREARDEIHSRLQQLAASENER